MRKVKLQRIEELYRLHKKRSEYLTEGMEFMGAEGIDSPKAEAAYLNAMKTEMKIEDKLSQVDREAGIIEGALVGKLIEAIFPMSISKVLKCLEVCGVEVEE